MLRKEKHCYRGDQILEQRHQGSSGHSHTQNLTGYKSKATWSNFDIEADFVIGPELMRAFDHTMSTRSSGYHTKRALRYKNTLCSAQQSYSCQKVVGLRLICNTHKMDFVLFLRDDCYIKSNHEYAPAILMCKNQEGSK